MTQTPEKYFDAIPCNQCGSRHMIQKTKQSESVYLDADGEIDHIEARDFIEVQAVWCADCDEKVWER
jgi:DNA-directed RNA polymerase subunit RPC12/RpoP